MKLRTRKAPLTLDSGTPLAVTGASSGSVPSPDAISVNQRDKTGKGIYIYTCTVYSKCVCTCSCGHYLFVIKFNSVLSILFFSGAGCSGASTVTSSDKSRG